MENEKMVFDKFQLQKIYTDFLSRTGYEHELKDYGDIIFKYKEHWFYIEVYEEDLEFGRLCFMIETQFNDTEKDFVYKVISKINGALKLTKACFRDREINGKQFVVLSIGYLFVNKNHFEEKFKRMIDEILNASQIFIESMSDLKKS